MGASTRTSEEHAKDDNAWVMLLLDQLARSPAPPASGSRGWLSQASRGFPCDLLPLQAAPWLRGSWADGSKKRGHLGEAARVLRGPSVGLGRLRLCMYIRRWRKTRCL